MDTENTDALFLLYTIPYEWEYQSRIPNNGKTLQHSTIYLRNVKLETTHWLFAVPKVFMVILENAIRDGFGIRIFRLCVYGGVRIFAI